MASLAVANGGTSASFHRHCEGHSCCMFPLNRKFTSLAYCCEFCVLCVCRQGTTATRQCAWTLFAVCCGVSTSRICSEPSVNTSTRMCWNRQRCRQCQFIPASGPQNNVHLLPKELDEKVAKMYFSALGAKLIVLSVEVGPTGTSPKAVHGASCERFCGDAKTCAI